MSTQNLQSACSLISEGVVVSVAGQTYFIPYEHLSFYETLSLSLSPFFDSPSFDAFDSPCLDSPSFDLSSFNSPFSHSPSFESPSLEFHHATGPSGFINHASITGQETQTAASIVNGFDHYLASEKFNLYNTDTFHCPHPSPMSYSQESLPSSLAPPVSNPVGSIDKSRSPPMESQLGYSGLPFNFLRNIKCPAKHEVTSNFSLSGDDDAQSLTQCNAAKRRRRSDTGKSRRANNYHGRRGTLRCGPCRKNHQRCVFNEGESCIRCKEKGVVDLCVKEWGPVTEKRRRMG